MFPELIIYWTVCGIILCVQTFDSTDTKKYQLIAVAISFICGGIIVPIKLLLKLLG